MYVKLSNDGSVVCHSHTSLPHLRCTLCIHVCDMQPVEHHIVFQFPQDNVTLPEVASDDDIHQLARTFYIRSDNLTDVALVHVGVVHSGNLSSVGQLCLFVSQRCNLPPFYMCVFTPHIAGCSDGLSACPVPDDGLLYSYRLSQTQCQLWDPARGEWTSDSCQVRMR